MATLVCFVRHANGGRLGHVPEKVLTRSCDSSHRNGSSEVDSPAVWIDQVRMSSPVSPGSSFDMWIYGACDRPINCSQYIGRATLAKGGLEVKSGEDSLCNLIARREKNNGLKLGVSEFGKENEVARGENVDYQFTLSFPVDVPGRLEGDLYQCFFEILDRDRTEWSCSVPEEGSLACVEVDLVITSRVRDTLSSVVAFGIAAAASWHLGKAFCMIRLPLITGYLFIGIVVGPYVTDLVSHYYIWLLGPALNDLALSFISFAAGEEIFFPSLSKIMRPILTHTTAVCVVTLVLILLGMTATAAVQSKTLLTGLGLPCQLVVTSLLATIMMARSPASAVAVLQEVGEQVDPRASQLLMGITVMSDVVVLAGFALMMALASGTCPRHVDESGSSLDWTDVVILLAQFAAMPVLGVMVGKLLVGILAIPFQRLQIRTLTIYRSYMKGALIVPLGFFVMQFLRYISVESNRRIGKSINIEPLMVCMIAASIASHSSTRRRQFANILEKTCKSCIWHPQPSDPSSIKRFHSTPSSVYIPAFLYLDRRVS